MDIKVILHTTIFCSKLFRREFNPIRVKWVFLLSLTAFLYANNVASQKLDIVTLNQESRKFGRVFTTQDERVELNRRREDGEFVDPTQHIKVKETVLKDSRNQMRFSGFIMSEDGKNTVWVDGESKLTKNATASNAKISRPSKVTQAAKIISENKSTVLKPGQVWLLKSDEVKEAYEIKPEVKLSEKKTMISEKNNVDAAIETLQTLKELQSP